ncbi:MAG: pyridoxamine 5'-phosphate oxidase family protein [Acidobacteriota bacterium]|nr:pyridoxamine 5'-phosphate oxidase family protein [Acidobacteriota bacterium]
MNWKEFKAAAPELAEAGEKLFERVGVVLVGTLRKDGSPRISPVEQLLVGGQLYLGMMPDSLKAQDLLRDGRCTVHSLISDKTAPEGEFKLHGVAVNVQDQAERKFYCDELKKKIGFSPEGMPFHLFSIDIQSAGLFGSDGGSARLLKRWRAGGPVEAFRQGIDGGLKPEGKGKRGRSKPAAKSN